MTADQLRAWRKRLGMTQAAAAEAIGISLRQYSYYETGRYPVPRPISLATEAIENRETHQ